MEDLNWKMLIAPLLILFIFIGGIIGIVNWQKSKQTQTVSTLSVNLPEGETQTTEKEISVNGKVKSGDKVYVNGEEVKVEKDGSYSKIVTLNSGENKIVVKDTKNGKEVKSAERTVKYTAPASQTTQTPSQTQEPARTPAPASSQAETATNLSTSGPEEIIIPVIGAGGIVLAIAYYMKSKKQLSVNLRK